MFSLELFERYIRVLEYVMKNSGDLRILPAEHRHDPEWVHHISLGLWRRILLPAVRVQRNANRSLEVIHRRTIIAARHIGLDAVTSEERCMDWKLELVILPVTDVDRAKAFYVEKIGFHLDHDQRVNDQLRFVQLTPPGSACSIAFGEGITTAPPGSVKGLQVVVADAQAARQELIDRGLEVADVDVQAWGSFIYFSDPDGNSWAVQQLPQRG